MSTTERGTLSFSSGVIPIATLVLGLTLSLIIVSLGTKQDVMAQQVEGVYQYGAPNVIGENNESTIISSPQQYLQLGSIDNNQFMMFLLSPTNPWISTGHYDMMDPMMSMMMDMMIPSQSLTQNSSNSSDMMTNSMEGPTMGTMMTTGDQ